MPKICRKAAGYKISVMVRGNSLLKFLLFSLVFFLGIILLFLLSFYVLMKKRMDANYKSSLNQKIQEALSRYYEEEEMKQELD